MRAPDRAERQSFVRRDAANCSREVDASGALSSCVYIEYVTFFHVKRVYNCRVHAEALYARERIVNEAIARAKENRFLY